jgi:protein gp37
MADNTHIEWADATVNWINGCELASPGCTNCYAMRLAGTRMKNDPTRKDLTRPSKSGPVWNGMVRNNPKHLVLPVGWRKPRRIFWNAHGDMFLGNVPDGWIDMQFAIMAITPQHTHMCLTKRNKRMRAYLTNPETPRRIAAVLAEFGDLLRVTPAMRAKALARTGEGVPEAVVWPLPNVWMGVSVEDQERANQRIPDLLASPAALRFLSCEPMLGPIDLGEVRWHVSGYPLFGALAKPDEPDDFRYFCHHQHGIRWVIVGGESGPGARPMHPEWARSLRDQCAAAGAIFHFKQWGEWSPREWKADQGTHALHRNAPENGSFQKLNHHPNSCERSSEAPSGWQAFAKQGKKAAGSLLDGIEHNGMPEVKA